MADTLIKTYNWVDGLIVLLLLIGAWRGYRSGLLRSIIGLITTVGAVLAAVFYYKPVTEIINQTFSLQEKIADFLTPKLQIPTMPLNETDPVAFLIKNMEKLKLPESTLIFLIRQVESIGRINIQANAGNLGALVAQLLSALLISALAFLLIYLAIQLLGRFLLFFLRRVLKLAGSWPDRIVGLLVGLLKAAALIVLTIAFLVPLLTSIGQGQINQAVSQSLLANRLMSLYYDFLTLFG